MLIKKLICLRSDCFSARNNMVLWIQSLFSITYRGTFSSSRRSAIWCGALSPWIARYNVQNTPPPSQNLRGFLNSSSSSLVLLAFRPARLPMLFKWFGAVIAFRRVHLRKFIIEIVRVYPLLSSTSIGSSKICVTFGRVSSAFSTGNVFDRKSSVRFRINSLKRNCWNAIEIFVIQRSMILVFL